MTATGDCSKVTAIILIQPTIYLQFGRAAHHAKLSFGPKASHGDFHFLINPPMLKGKRTEVSTFPTSVPNSCNLDLALNLFPNLSLKFRLPPD